MALDLKAGTRKILRVKAMWVLDGHAPVAARTLDLGTSGVSVHVEQMVKEGAKGQISFEMFTDGKTHMISAKVAVTYCIFSSGEFKVGMQFLQLDPQTAQVLGKFMR